VQYNYSAGRIAVITGHGGNIYELAKNNNCKPEEIIDMSSNLNPLGTPPGLLEYLKQNISAIKALPDAGATFLIKKFENFHDLKQGQVLAGHGTTEFIYSITKALQIKNALILGPTYSDYKDSCMQNNCHFTFLMAEDSNDFIHNPDQISDNSKNKDMVFICNPNNPTGTLISSQILHRICESHPDTIFVIDESYLPFIPKDDTFSMIHTKLKNVIVLNSMSKIFSIPGLRTGFLKASPEIINQCQKYQLPWNVNSLAQIAADYILTKKQEMAVFIQETRNFIKTEKMQFISRFQGVSALSCLPSQVPYILIRLNTELTAATFCNNLSKENILIRNCSNFDGLSDKYIRVALKNSSVNQVLADKLLQVIKNS
jgi:threonine-phosphate decarboxylase